MGVETYTLSKSEKIFLIALFAFTIFISIHGSLLNAFQGIVKISKYTAFGATVAIGYWSFALNFRRLNIYEKIIGIVFGFSAIFLYYQNSNYIIASVAIVFSSIGLDYDFVIRKIRNAAFVSLVVVSLLCLIGILKDIVIQRDEDFFGSGLAHSMGFYYYSGFSYLTIGILMCQVYIWRNNLTLKRALLLLMFSIISFAISYTRLQITTCIIFTGICYLLSKFSLSINNKVFLLIGLIIYPILCYGMYYISTETSWGWFMANFDYYNDLLNGRLLLNERAFDMYKILPWGQIIEKNTSDVGQYFYIDSGYISYLLNNGWVFTSALMISYSYIYYKVVSTNNVFLYIWLTVFAMLNTVNGFVWAILYNPIIFLLFTNHKHEYDEQ